MKIKSIQSLLFSCVILTYSSDALTQSNNKEVGVLLPLTGEVAAFGAKLRSGIDRAHSSKVRFIFEDDACQSSKALTAYENLKRRGVQYFLGPCCGASMKTVAPRFSAGEQLSFATCPVSDEAYSASNGRVFLPQYSVEDEATFNAHEIYQQGARKVVLLFQNSEFARSNERIFRSKFAGEVLESFVYDTPDVMALRPLLLRLKQSEYDAIYVPHVEPFLLGVLKEMAKLGIRGKKIYSVYSAQMEEVLVQNGSAAEGFMYSYPDIPLEEDAISYFPKIAAEMLIEAIEHCSSDFTCVNRHLRTKYEFSNTGVLKRPIVLRTVKNGKFALANEAPITTDRSGQKTAK